MKLTGGHSIGTAMPRFEFSPSVAKGAPESEHGIIRVNPADADIVPKLSRSILRDQTDAQLEESVQQALQSTERVGQRTEMVALRSSTEGLHWQTSPAAAGFSTDGAPRAAMWAEPTDSRATRVGHRSGQSGYAHISRRAVIERLRHGRHGRAID